MKHRFSTYLCVSNLLATLTSLAANPIDLNPAVVAGQVDFAGLSGHDAVITQASQKAIVDYSHFNIPEGNSVQFIQPNSNAALLNRITGADPSTINGSLTANGQIYFVNPAGVTFGANSVIRADMFMAIAGQVSNADFLNNIQNFKLSGSIVNHGSIVTERGVGLFGQQVTNTGEIVAKNGYAIVASGDEIHVRQGGTILAVDVTDAAKASKSGTGIINLGTVDGEEVMFSAGDAFATAIQQSGKVKARKSAKVHSDGGRVEVTGSITVRDAAGKGGRIEVGGTDQGADTAPASSSTLIADSALLDASSDTGKGGHIVVWSDGHTDFRGVADASSRAGDGGFIEASGKTIDFVNMLSQIRLGSGGHFLLDPTDVLIDSTLATSIEGMLDNGVDFTVTTSTGGTDAGDITVAANIQVPANNLNKKAKLTLIADQDIIVNSQIIIQNLQEDFAVGETVFDFQAGRNIELSGDVVHSGFLGETGRGSILMSAVGNLNINNAFVDSNGGSIQLIADQVTLTGFSGNLSAGIVGENTAIIDIAAASGLTFAGGSITTYGGADIFIDTGLLTNNTGSTAISRINPAESFFAIHLPNPIDDGEAIPSNHLYNGVQSGSRALFNVTDFNAVKTGGISGNRYYYTFQPTMDITAQDGVKTYGNTFNLLTGGPAVIVDTNDFVQVPLGNPFLQDTTANTLDLTGVTTASSGAIASADVVTPAPAITATGATSNNGYAFNYKDGALTINKRAVTLTANQQNKQYGDVLSLVDTAFALADQGDVNDSTLPNGNTIDTVVLNSVTGVDASTTTGVGTYTDEIKITGQSGSGGFLESNYAFTYIDGNLVVDARNVTVTASQQNKFYGDVLDLTSTASQSAFTILDNGLTNGGDALLPNGETIDSVSLQSVLPIDVAASTTEPVATYSDELRVTGVTGGNSFDVNNYNLTFVDGDLVIDARPITLTPNDQSKQYGDVLPLGTTAFTVLDNGLTDGGDAALPNGEQIDNVDLLSAGGLAASTDQDASATPYADNLSIDSNAFGSANGSNGFNASNYDITFATGDLTINPRQIELIAGRQEKFYGDILTLDDTTFSVVDQGNALDSALPNAETIDTVTINSVTGVDASTSSDANLYSNEIAISSPVTGSAGTGDGFLESNYDITFTSGDLLVKPRPIAVTPSEQQKTYGDVHILGNDNTFFTVTDLDNDATLPNGELIDTVNIISRGGHDASTTSNAVTYTDDLQITSFGTGSNGFNPDNYTFDFTTLGDFVINRRVATINATEQRKDYGDVHDLGNTAFTVIDRDGGALPNGETIDTVTLVSAAGIDASTDADAATYTDNISITPTSTGTPTLTGSNGFNQENYNLSYGAADFTVDPRAVTLTASLQDKIYGNVLTLDDTAFTTLDKTGGSTLPNGEVVTNVTINSATGVDASTTADAATYTDEIVISGPVTGTPGSGDGFVEANYDITYVAGDLLVNKRAITVTPLQQEKTYGDVHILGNDNTFFKVTDLDNDSILPNGELIDTVNIISRGGHDASTTSNAVTYTDDLEITNFGTGSNGFNPDNYTFDFTNLGDFVINRRVATINATEQRKDYGDVHDLGNTAFTVIDRDGGALPNGETIDTVTLVSAAGIDASTDADAGTYTDNISITPTSTGTPTLTGSNGFNQENYNLSYGAADFTVDPRAITLAASQQDKIYGDVLNLDNTAFTTLDKTGGSTLPNGEVITNVTINSATGIDASTTADATTYTDEIVISGPVTGTPGSGDGFVESNYDITYVAGDLLVSKRGITLTALPQGKIYGENVTPSTTAFSVINLANSETIDTVAITSAVASDTTADVGTYIDDLAPTTILSSSNGFNEANYDVTRVNGDYTITPRAITITANEQSKIYGESETLDPTSFDLFDPLSNSANLPNGEGVTTISFAPTTLPGSTTANVGTYSNELTPIGQNGSNGFKASNYAISYQSGDYIINRRSIDLAINSDKRFAGSHYTIDPTAFVTTDILSGGNALPNGETVDSLAIFSVNGVAEDPSAPHGFYPAELDADPASAIGSNGFDLSNYSVNVTPGDFEIEPYPGLAALSQEGAMEVWIKHHIGFDPTNPFSNTYAISQSLGLRLIALPSWGKLDADKQQAVLKALDEVPLHLQTLTLAEKLIENVK